MAAGLVLEVVKLGGETISNPETLASTLSCDQLRRQVATKMKTPWRAVQLAAGEQPLQGPETLDKMGLVEGKHQIQVVLQDNSREIRQIQEELVKCSEPGTVLADGLSDEQVEILEKKYGFCFPPEYLEFLQAGVPTGGGWHDWHALVSLEEGSLEDTVSEIIRCHCTPDDDSDDYYYLNPWAPEDEKSLEKAVEYATKIYPAIPICYHRCTLTVPHTSGLPVMSMHQMSDNIQVGDNFWDWMAKDNDLPEGTVPEAWRSQKSIPLDEIPFWQHWGE